MKKTLLTGLFAVASLSAMAQVTFVNGTLTITTGPANDAFEVRSINNNNRVTTVQLIDVPGGNNNTRYRGVTNIIVRTNGGDDQVKFVAQGGAHPALDADLGAGKGTFDIEFIGGQPLVPITSNIRFTGSSLEDVVNIQMLSRSNSFLANWNFDLRDGQNAVQGVITSEIARSLGVINLTVAGGIGEDNVGIDFLSNAQSLTFNPRINLGAGNDNLLINATGNQLTDLFLNTGIDLGAGQDKLVMSYTDMLTTTWNGSALLGAGADAAEISVIGDLYGSASLDLGADADTAFMVVSQGNYGSQRVTAGSGDDVVEHWPSAGLFGTPSFDGGAGFDKFYGLGTPVGFEEVN